jgi:triphosphoribosyl-dephospho-CoA synthase
VSSSGLAQLSAGQLAALACLLEATAPKPGNVHPGARFADMTHLDFVASAIASAPAMDSAVGVSLGQTVLDAVRATRQLVGKNTNLGTLLLLAPLAKVPRGQPLRPGVAEVLAGMNAEDARLVYEAIRLAQPGGLGSAPAADVHDEPPPDLLAAMRLAADRDLVARQYTNAFAEVLDFIVPRLQQGHAAARPLLDAIVYVQLQVMCDYPDTLIARKCGAAVAQESARRAAAVLAAGAPGELSYVAAMADFDLWLRADGHRRNPGTTADLLAAGLFAALRDGLIDLHGSK